jgi:hypothetical protein
MDRSTAPQLDNPFSDSAAPSIRAISQFSQYSDSNRSGVRQPAKRQFKSYRLNGEYERTWTGDKRLKKTRVGNYIIWAMIGAGIAISAYLNYNVTRKVQKHDVCSDRLDFVFGFWYADARPLVLPDTRRSIFNAESGDMESRSPGKR